MEIERLKRELKQSKKSATTTKPSADVPMEVTRTSSNVFLSKLSDR